MKTASYFALVKNQFMQSSYTFNRYKIALQKRIFVWLILWLLLINSWHTAFGAENSSTKDYKLPTAIADNYLRSFASQAEEQQKEIAAEIKKDAPAHEARPAKLDVATMRKVIFNHILTKSEKISTLQQQMEAILNEYAWGDLKLFYGTTTDPGYHLISRINRTVTTLGEAALATLLVTPTTNIYVLQERQHILKILLSNPEQLEELSTCLRVCQDAEQSIVSFWTATDPLYSKEYMNYMEDKFYAKGKNASNKSAGWLEFKKRIFRDFWSIQYRFLYPFTAPAITEMFFYDEITESGTRKKLWKDAIPYYGHWKQYRRISRSIEKVKRHGGDTSGLKFLYLIPITSAGIYTWIAYGGIQNYLEYSSVLRHLALRMADVQAFIVTADQVSKKIANSLPLEAAYGQHLTAVRSLLAKSKEHTELGRLIKYLQELPLSDWSYFFNNAGKLLAGHKLFIEHKEAFSDAMYEIGLLDAHLSFATLMQEAAVYNSKHTYVFVDFLDRNQRTKPYLKMEDMWNPFLDSKQAVGNSIEMDGEAGGMRNVILTGPNAGGKSTFLTGVTNALLLAHVMGIGPAKQIVITPFSRINTYIDIADDIAAGKSLFMAEVDRAQKHIKLLEKLKPNEFSFSIFDEPFSGTNPIEGAAAEYSILEALADYTNSLTMVATHYPIVMLLEEKVREKGFANYKVYITRQPTTGKLNYTYKIVRGKSNQAIAIDILEEQGYDTRMLARAREIIEHPENYQSNF